jgi:hypothetical protein
VQGYWPLCLLKGSDTSLTRAYLQIVVAICMLDAHYWTAYGVLLLDGFNNNVSLTTNSLGISVT